MVLLHKRSQSSLSIGGWLVVAVLIILFLISFLLALSHDLLFAKILGPHSISIIQSFNRDSTVNVANYTSYVCDNKGPLNNHSAVLRTYCKMVPNPNSLSWTAAQNYSESDVGFIIFTASIFYHTRTTAVRDTWLSRVTYKYYLGATPYPWLPVTVIEGAGEDKLSNMKKIFYGLQIIYKQQEKSSKPHKWYYLAGCDTFVNVPYVLKRLDPHDHTQPILVGGHNGGAECPDNTGKKHSVEFPSGGAGLFFSSKLLELMMPHLTDYVENVWPRKLSECGECSDVALTCLVFKLGIRLTKMPGFWAHNPERTIFFDGKKVFHREPEPNNYHYVPYQEMYDLDEFYSFQFIDRLVNDRQWEELTKYTRLFVASHYELLRAKLEECTLPLVPNGTAVSVESSIVANSKDKAKNNDKEDEK